MRRPLLPRHYLARRLARRIAHQLSGDRGETGAAALEFGLILPVVMLAIFGIIQYGYLFWSLETAAATAREAARRLVVGTDWTCTQAEAVDQASRPAVGGVPAQVSRRYHTEGGATQSAPVVGSLVTVTVSFQSLDMGLPFLPLPHAGLVTETSTGRVETVPPQRLKCDETQDYVAGTGTY